MEFICPFCRTLHDVDPLPDQFVCSCGHPLKLEGIKSHYKQEARRKMRLIQQKANHICSLILMSGYPEVDIEIEKTKLRDLVRMMFPDQMDLYRMIYESRFERLWEQFRTEI